MPLLSEFTKSDSSGHVVVFSAEIFERRPGAEETAKSLFADSGYAMRLVAAGDSLGAMLGFDSIPTMYVIGPDGHIAYKHVGYSPTLVQELRWEVASLFAKPSKH